MEEKFAQVNPTALDYLSRRIDAYRGCTTCMKNAPTPSDEDLSMVRCLTQLTVVHNRRSEHYLVMSNTKQPFIFSLLLFLLYLMKETIFFELKFAMTSKDIP